MLRAIGAAGDRELPVAEAALALAALSHPGTDLGRYRHHLSLLSRDVGEEAGPVCDLAARIEALNTVILGKYGYCGDTQTYDDLQNADLIRVIDRRRGLPVALGILYIHTARAQGWTISGLGFPGHFMLLMQGEGERAILDPFNSGKVRGAADLRELLRAMAGEDAELTPEHYRPVADRDVLLRLQNNLKLRLVQQQQASEALAVIESMLMFAPDQADLWRESGLLHAHLGNLKAAISALETYLLRDVSGTERHRTTLYLQQLRGQLN
jgi:regulator of sirC expression with transglutaminase-like and TPR domain